MKRRQKTGDSEHRQKEKRPLALSKAVVLLSREANSHWAEDPTSHSNPHADPIPLFSLPVS
jgi:hypothetical protein